MKVISTMKIGEDEIARFKEVNPEVEVVLVKEFSEPDEKAEVLLTYGWDVKVETLDLYPNLKWIQAMVAGVDAMPMAQMAERGILLTNVKGTHRIQMAEHTIWSILSLMRQTRTVCKQQEQKIWSARLRLDEMYGKTVCIVGTGAIGETIAEKCRAFGMTVLGISRSGKTHPAFDQMGANDQIPEFLGKSDVVVVVLPLTMETNRFFNAERFGQMKEGSYFINVARGPVVDEDALLEALQSGKIKGAALDVFVNEPLPEDSPFWNLDNVLITPHIGGRSPYYTPRMWEIFVKNLEIFPDSSELINLIDLQKGY